MASTAAGKQRIPKVAKVREQTSVQESHELTSAKLMLIEGAKV